MTKYASIGTRIQMHDGISTYTDLAQLQTISGPDLSQDLVDVTAHDSPGKWEEQVATVLRSGEVTLGVVFDPVDDTQDAVVGLIKVLTLRVTRSFKIIFPNTAATTWTFTAFVTRCAPNPGSHTDALMMDATLKLTGAPTLT